MSLSTTSFQNDRHQHGFDDASMRHADIIDVLSPTPFRRIDAGDRRRAFLVDLDMAKRILDVNEFPQGNSHGNHIHGSGRTEES